MRRLSLLAAATFVLAATPSLAQEYRFSANTARGYTGYAQEFPNIQMKRRADNLVVSITVACDTRDADTRKREITETLRALARAAGADAGIDLSLDKDGNVINFDESMVPNLSYFSDGGRPDTSAVNLVVKTPVSTSDTLEAASDRIRAFVNEAPKTGRTELRILEDWEPTVVSPDQYRDDILGLIAGDARATTAAFGNRYGVEVTGLHRQVTWRQAGPLDLSLFIPYTMSITPAS